ncbi:DNA-processing protein DprA [Sphingomonas sp. BAUL-RG-20F-R05-02]|uniref:DNA-processing protein DprA n=1 Tax=Sphingomonas sp. BAUL-RG-20F-R05-02 TaxID=2914830 RepID=UPI001F575ABF|nr:DNA-processing protein DprA [Sphingomonas sp. BAUL-RG-20F-R05-02]
MADAAEVARLRLIRTAQIGPVTYRQLVARFGDAAAAIEALPGLAARGGGRSPVVALPAVAERELAAARKLGARHLFIEDADYPELLAQLDDASPVVMVRGNVALLARDCVAMVGARNASAAACRFSRQIAAELGRDGITVVSGLARGVDTAAHVGSIEGGTIGVIAGGIDVVYPPENADLQERIAREGLLIAEQPPGIEPRARHFPHRNRIIAGASLGTLVVEAAPRSGSLITARLAGEMGREVMAVPGSPLDPRAQGCNGLIQHTLVALRTRLYRFSQFWAVLCTVTSRSYSPMMPAPQALTATDSNTPVAYCECRRWCRKHKTYGIQGQRRSRFLHKHPNHYTVRLANDCH